MSASTRESKATSIESKEVLLVPRDHPLYLPKLKPCYKGVESKDRSDDQKAEVKALKAKLPLLNKIWVGREGTAGDWNVAPAQDGSYLAWVEVNDLDYKLSYSQRITESICLMQYAQQKTELPFPAYRHSNRQKAGKCYFVLFPCFEKYLSEDLIKAASYCERSWRHSSNASSASMRKRFLKKKDISFAQTFKRFELFESIQQRKGDELQYAAKVKNYTEVKAKKYLKSEEKNKSNWYQESELPKHALVPAGESYYKQSYSEIEKFKSLFMDYLNFHKIKYEFLMDPADSLFIDSGIPSELEKLTEYRKTIIEKYTEEQAFYEIYFIHHGAVNVHLVSKYIEEVIRCFSSSQYIQKINVYDGIDTGNNMHSCLFTVIFFGDEMKSKLVENTVIKKLIEFKEVGKMGDKEGLRIGCAFDATLIRTLVSGMSEGEILIQKQEQCKNMLSEHFKKVKKVWDNVLCECRRIEPADEEITNVVSSQNKPKMGF